MKRYALVFLTAMFALSLSAQKQEVIASAGGYNSAGDISISWTLGETIIPTFSAGGLILTHGFQQQLIVTTIEENLLELVNVTVYPNPAIDVLNIKFELPLDGAVDLYLLTQQGSLVLTDFIEATSVEKQVNMQGFPAGVYFVRLVKGKLNNVYKVVKL
ncbi:MAG: T9SS type A sorting domain-containing protein [Bacteroidota bacterium]